MSQQTINIGSSANDGTGDPLRTAFDKINDNFTELYGSSPFGQQITISGNKISSNVSNANIILETSGTGAIEMEGIQIRDNHIEATRSNDDLVLLGSGTGGVVFTGVTIVDNEIKASRSNDALVLSTAGTGKVTASGGLIVTGGDTETADISSSGQIDAVGFTATGSSTFDGITINDNVVSTSSNADLNLSPGGTGAVVASGIRVVGTTLSADDSSIININEGLVVDGTGNFSGTLTTANVTTVGFHAVTGQSDIDFVRIKDNEITTNASDADLVISANGSGNVVAGGITINGTSLSAADSSTININEGLNVDGSVTVQGTTNTADVATTGNTTISGSLTTGTLAVGDLNIIADGTITSDTNGDIAIDPAGTGAIVLTGPITHTGTQTTTGQLNVDNLRLDGNVLSATSGAITLTPADGQNVTIGGTNTNLTAAEANFTLMEATTARADTIESDTSNADLVFNTQGTGVFDFNAAIKMAEVSKPTAVADHGFIYVKDDSGTAEVFVLDAADNETKISPHNDNGEWEYFSRNSRTGKTVRINMEAMIRDLENFTGNKYIENE